MRPLQVGGFFWLHAPGERGSLPIGASVVGGAGACLPLPRGASDKQGAWLSPTPSSSHRLRQGAVAGFTVNRFLAFWPGDAAKRGREGTRPRGTRAPALFAPRAHSEPWSELSLVNAAAPGPAAAPLGDVLSGTAAPVQRGQRGGRRCLPSPCPCTPPSSAAPPPSWPGRCWWCCCWTRPPSSCGPGTERRGWGAAPPGRGEPSVPAPAPNTDSFSIQLGHVGAPHPRPGGRRSSVPPATRVPTLLLERPSPSAWRGRAGGHRGPKPLRCPWSPYSAFLGISRFPTRGAVQSSSSS